MDPILEVSLEKDDSSILPPSISDSILPLDCEPLTSAKSPGQVSQLFLPEASMEDNMQFKEDLHMRLIEYISQSCRLLFVENRKTWSNFHTNSDYNYNHFADLGVDELRSEFNEVILPNIFTYNLSDQQKASLNLLKVNPQYIKTNNGYDRQKKEERRSPNEPKLGVHYTFSKKEQTASASPSCLPETNEPESEGTEKKIATTVMPEKEVDRTVQRYKPKLSPAIHAWLSAVLSNDSELAICQLFPVEEIIRRLSVAREEFEQTGQLPMNLLSGEELIQKVMRYYEARERMASVVDEKFM